MASSVTKNYIPQIDYVSRDYTAILADLTAIARQFNPTWQVSDPADIGVALIETFAYLGDLLSFYTDRMASEGFIGTASQRSSVLQIASMLGYTPTPSSAATVTLNITNNSSSSAITVLAGTQFPSTSTVNGQSTQVIFELDSDLTIGASSSSSANVTQGVTTTGEALGTSTGAPSQIFKLSQTGVILNSTGSNLKVYVGGVQYTYSSSLVDNNPFDSVFTTSMDADGYTYIIFGDGVGGKIPPATYSVTATYRVGVGSQGNVAAGSIKSTLGNYNISVSQASAATGGADDESTDSIRYNTPRAIRTLRRAVSLRDYAYLALQVNGVSKANADSGVWSSVNLYVAPFSSSAVNTYGPFVGSSTAVITGITTTASDGTAYSSGTVYLTYTAAAGTFSAFTANSTYVNVSGAAPVLYNIYTGTSGNTGAVVTNVATDGSSFTVATSFTNTTAFTTSPYNATLSSAISVSAYGLPTTAFTTLKNNVLSYFTDKVAPNVSLTVANPSYVPVNIDLTLHVLPQYTQTTVVTQVQAALTSLVSYNNAFFADRLPPHFILNALTNIDGVDYATVDHLRRASNEQVCTITSWTRTTSTATLLTPKTNNIVAGQNVRLYNSGGIDGTYAVTAVSTDTSITIAVPGGVATPGYATAVTYTSTTPGLNLTISSTAGVTVGMNVIATDVPTGSIVTSVNSSTSITINKVLGITSGYTRNVTFSQNPVDATNYVKVVGVDSTTSAGVTNYGIACAANEIPTKGTFTIAATGGLS
jgi:hypothetical protein